MSSTLERLDPDFRIPYDEPALESIDPKAAGYLLELVKTLQALLEKITTVANYGLDSYDGEAFYLGTKNANGSYPTGTWRIIKVDSSLQFQEKVSDTGVEADDWTKVGGHSRSSS